MADLDDQIPVVQQDPTDPEFVQDPYAFYRRIRSLGNFVHWKDYDLDVATTQAAVAQVLKHPRLGRAMPEEARVPVPAGLQPFYALEEHSLLELEPPDHTRIRRLATEGFVRTHLAMMAPTVSQITDRLINEFPDGAFDLLEHYSKPLTALTITEFLGIEASHARQLQTWSNAMVAMYQARRDDMIERKAAKAASEFTDFVTDVIRARRKLDADNFLGHLIAAEETGVLSRAELLSTVILLLNAGHEATAHAIGNSVNLMTGYSERALALQPENIANTVEECLRFSPPLHLFRRHVYETVTILGQKFQRGDEIGCLLGSSCRDDAVWPDGDKFDPFRMRRNHQAFGAGLHACLGASLARLEMQIALPALFSRCPDLRIVEPPRVANLYHFHGLERLAVGVR